MAIYPPQEALSHDHRDHVFQTTARCGTAFFTPVIIVDKLQYPGGGTYSARLLIYEHTYAGSWSGGDHGGLMNGVITNEKE